MMWYRKAILGFMAGQFVLVGLFAQQETKNTKPETPASQKDVNNAKDGAKKEQPKIDSEEKNEIKKWTKEKLLKEMGKANHTLSREGQEWLKSKVKLEIIISKQKATYNELKNDKSIALTQDKLNGAKDSLIKLKDIKDEKEIEKEINKIIDKCELKQMDIQKFIAYKDAEYTIKLGGEGLDKISKHFEKPLKGTQRPKSAKDGTSARTQVETIVESIPGETEKPDETDTEPKRDPNIAKRLLEALSR
jgi:hypothetical protein